MGVKFTEEQQQVIDARECNLLVSAAAGSGKTAVLVERVITRLTKEQPPLNVDQLLVVTFTDAAAAEMKSRIREAIEKELTQHPENEHLQRQAALIHQAKISTIHTFCTSVINEHFHVLDLDPSVRVGETGEIELIKRDALEKVLEDAYAKGDKEFLNLVECYARGKNDKPLEELVLRLYKDAQSHPNPRIWLEDCIRQYEVETVGDLEEKEYVQELVGDIKAYLKGWKEQLEYAVSVCESEEGPRSYVPALSSDLQQLDKILKAESFFELQKTVSSYESEKLKGKKKTDVVDELKQNQVKGIRTKFLKYIDEIKTEYFAKDFQEIQHNMHVARRQVEALAHLVMDFDLCFVEEKRKKNVIDFNDMEHFALKILTVEQDGEFIPSDVARGYQEKFSEIMIDEYQDINRLQDTIMTSVSGIRNGRNNLFMVGDVKQSIYRFRLSCPQLFMEKYHRYEEHGSQNRRIDLHKNFRSRKEVLNSANFIFEQVMSKEFGGIVYDENAALHVGAEYQDVPNNQTEVLLLDFSKILVKERRELEGQVLAKKIKELVGNHEIYDRKKDAYRKVEYGDIAILSRNLKSVGDIYVRVFNEAGIPIHMNIKEGYFETYEIQTVLNYLRILDNPRQDIPYTAVLTSLFGKFTAEELAQIRNYDKKVGMYECVQGYLVNGENKKLQERLLEFQKMFQHFRDMVPTCAIHVLLWKLLEESGFMEAMSVFPNGEQRVANLEMLVQKATSFESSSYKGLFNFVRYIEQMERYEVENGPASLVDEQMDAVTLMTVHKSKGLEFPIVFLAQCGKDFNYKSAQGEIVVHPDIGIGVEAVEPQKRTKTSTLLQKVISRKIVMESAEEEARLLYVAMTRAKEKLYLLGDSDNMAKKVKDLEIIKACKEKEIPYYQVSTAKSYLDWILLSLYRNVCMKQVLNEFEIAPAKVTPLYAEEVPILVKRITWDEVIEQEAEEQLYERVTREILHQWNTQEVYDENVKRQLEEQLSYHYPYEGAQRVKQKISVSELKKQIYMEEEGDEAYREEEVIPLLPKFLQEGEELRGAPRGTAYHKVMEMLDFTKTYNEETLKQEISELKNKGYLTEQMIESIRQRDILLFLQSDLGIRMQRASQNAMLKAEQPFVMGMEAKDVYPDSQSEEMVLIQGIIDAYFEEEGELVVVDYKTDRVSNENELKERYHSQLEYYAEALARLTGKNVKEKVIYSFTLKKEIEV